MPSQGEVSYNPFEVVMTDSLKLISDYSRIDFMEILNLDCVVYKLLFRDALIYKLKQSEQGKDYLQDCWILQQTNPDRKALRDNFSNH